MINFLPLLQETLVNQVFAVDFLQDNLLQMVWSHFMKTEADRDSKGDAFSIKVDWGIQNNQIFVK